MSLLLGIEPFKKFVVGGGGGWWSKDILEFRFGPNLGLRLGRTVEKTLNLSPSLCSPQLLQPYVICDSLLLCL